MKNVIKYTKQYRFILNGTLNSYMRTTYDLRFKSNEVYLRKCKQVNILPLLYRFMFNDMNLFHKVVYKIIPVTMPGYLTLYSGDSRLRSTHLDNLSFVSNIASTTTSISNLIQSFLFCSHTLWNFLPFDLRNSMILSQF